MANPLSEKLLKVPIAEVLPILVTGFIYQRQNLFLQVVGLVTDFSQCIFAPSPPFPPATPHHLVVLQWR